MADQARRTAFAAAAGREVEFGEAVPAKAGRAGEFGRGGGHGTSRSQAGSFSAW